MSTHVAKQTALGAGFCLAHTPGKKHHRPIPQPGNLALKGQDEDGPGAKGRAKVGSGSVLPGDVNVDS